MKKQILTLTAILTASAMAAAGRSVTAHVPAPEDSVPASGVCTPQISAAGRTVKKYRFTDKGAENQSAGHKARMGTG